MHLIGFLHRRLSCIEFQALVEAYKTVVELWFDDVRIPPLLHYIR